MKSTNCCLILLAAIGLYACTLRVEHKPDTPKEAPANPGERVLSPGVALFIDPEMGCQYLSTNFGRTLTPRMGKDGKQVCQ